MWTDDDSNILEKKTRWPDRRKGRCKATVLIWGVFSKCTCLGPSQEVRERAKAKVFGKISLDDFAELS